MWQTAHVWRPRASERRVHFRRAATCAAPCCRTRLSQHVGEAHVGAEGGVHLHPGGHGVQLTVVMELVQKFLKNIHLVKIIFFFDETLSLVSPSPERTPCSFAAVFFL